VARYIPVARRRRNAAIAAALALLAGIVLGWLIGKQSAPSVSSAVKDTQQQAADLAIQLERLPIEYAQAVGGQGDTVEAGVIAPLDEIQAATTNAFGDAPWIAPAVRASTQDALAEVRRAALDNVSASEFEAAVTGAADTIRTAFGLSTNSS
jgi:hypothetical protein